MKKHLLLALAASLTFGCTTPDIFNEHGSASYKSIKDGNMLETTSKAGDHLMAHAPYLKNDHRAILITSIADITNLDTSSAFGLMVSEQIGDRFAHYGFPVVDLRTRKDVKVREENGEYMLSRDIRKISKEHAADAALVGTYAIGGEHVYVSTRLVRPQDNRILSSYDFKLPLGPDVRKMVRKKTR